MRIILLWFRFKACLPVNLETASHLSIAMMNQSSKPPQDEIIFNYSINVIELSVLSAKRKFYRIAFSHTHSHNLNKKEFLCFFLGALRFTELSCARRTVSFSLRPVPAIPAHPPISPVNKFYIYVYVVGNFITFLKCPEIHYF